MAKTPTNSHFYIFFVIKDPFKKNQKQKNLNSTSTAFWGNIVVNIHAKYRKDRMKTEGAYSI